MKFNEISIITIRDTVVHIFLSSICSFCKIDIASLLTLNRQTLKSNKRDSLARARASTTPLAPNNSYRAKVQHR